MKFKEVNDMITTFGLSIDWDKDKTKMTIIGGSQDNVVATVSLTRLC